MNNEVDDIAGLFDEFFIIDEDQPAATPESVPVIKNAPAEPAAPAEVKPPAREPVLPPVPKEPSLPAPQYSGANKKHIAIIYNDKNNDSRENVEMLSNLITKALKFSMDDVAVIRVSKNPGGTLTHFFDTLKIKQAIVWGAPELLQQEEIRAEIHELVKVGNTHVMIADSVHEYHGKSEYKAKLWETIQKLFGQ